MWQVIDKFYDIKEQTSKVSEDASWEDKCESLLYDSTEMWTFRCQEEETSTSNYVVSLINFSPMKSEGKLLLSYLFTSVV